MKNRAHGLKALNDKYTWRFHMQKVLMLFLTMQTFMKRIGFVLADKGLFYRKTVDKNVFLKKFRHVLSMVLKHR